MTTIEDVLSGRAQWCVIQGDCLEVLPTLPDRRVDHVITDPPYEAEAHTLQRRQFRADLPPNEYGAGKQIGAAPLAFPPITECDRDAAAAQCARLAARWALVFCQVEAAMKWGGALSAHGAPVRRVGIWVKPDGMPQFSGDRPAMGYETIVFAHRDGRSRWNGGGRHGVFTAGCHRDPGDDSGHQTQKPVPLMLELVELFTDPGEVILDPFCGSGTTGVACLRLGRRFIGIERDEKYATIARERLEAETQGMSLRSYRAGQMALFGGGA